MNTVLENLDHLPGPCFPVYGRGNRRKCFPFIRRKNSYGKWLWDHIPAHHKCHLRYGNAGSSLFWRGVPGNIVVSPECYDFITENENELRVIFGRV